MKLLTICIPTYKRSSTLERCINSIVDQIVLYKLEEKVQLHVSDDASPDATALVLKKFEPLPYFDSVCRDVNMGMSANILRMLKTLADKSHYQLIITDDDYLQPDSLKMIFEYLGMQRTVNPNASLIWTPRYSYTEDGNLLCVVCKPFEGDRVINPTVRNAGRYMYNGFVLSGLFLRAKDINFDLWGEFVDNAYFPVIISGDIMARKNSLFWDKNIVHHTVNNLCHWERWGSSDAEIALKKFIDCINAYPIVYRDIKKEEGLWGFLVFLWVSFPHNKSITSSVTVGGVFDRLSNDQRRSLLSKDKLSFSNIEAAYGWVVLFSVCMIGLSSIIKFSIFMFLSKLSKGIWLKKAQPHKRTLSNIKFLLAWIRARYKILG